MFLIYTTQLQKKAQDSDKNNKWKVWSTHGPPISIFWKLVNLVGRRKALSRVDYKTHEKKAHQHGYQRNGYMYGMRMQDFIYGQKIET